MERGTLAEHKGFIGTVEAFRAQLMSDAAILPIDVRFFLGDRLRHHILNSDQRYMELLGGENSERRAATSIR